MKINFKHKIKNNEDGQAIFETLLFLPILIYLLMVMLQVGNSINASINQQKAARGFTYFLMKGNSYGNRSMDVQGILADGNVTVTAAVINGWAEKIEGKKSYGTCFKLPTIIGDTPEAEDCDEVISDTSSQFIKIFTSYGVCGETFTAIGDAIVRADHYQSQVGIKNCIQSQ